MEPDVRLKTVFSLPNVFLMLTLALYWAVLCAKSPQSCLTLCAPMDCSPPGFSVPGILQARILEWECQALLQGIFLTQGLNQRLLCLLHWPTGPLPLAPLGELDSRGMETFMEIWLKDWPRQTESSHLETGWDLIIAWGWRVSELCLILSSFLLWACLSPLGNSSNVPALGAKVVAPKTQVCTLVM